MHHSGGAWSETLYIYLPAMRFAAESGHMHIMSLGLGLAYNEIISSALHFKLLNPGKASMKSIKIVSFEVLDTLRESFKSYVLQEKSTYLTPCYEDILQRACAHFELKPLEFRDHLKHLFQERQLELRGPFPMDLQDHDTFNCFLYDAFSNKMSPSLWDEEFLKTTIGRLASKDCVFSTYAATGTIKRAMKFLNFTKQPRPGFAGKRDSSFYTRSERAFLDTPQAVTDNNSYPEESMPNDESLIGKIIENK